MYPPILIVVAAVIVADGRMLLARRLDGSHLAGHWEFPGGKVEHGEAPVRALKRELEEELGAESDIGEPFAFNYHEYADRRVLLLAYLAKIRCEPRPLGCAELGWFTPGEAAALKTPPADGPVFARLEELLQPPSCSTS